MVPENIDMHLYTLAPPRREFHLGSPYLHGFSLFLGAGRLFPVGAAILLGGSFSKSGLVLGGQIQKRKCYLGVILITLMEVVRSSKVSYSIHV